VNVVLYEKKSLRWTSLVGFIRRDQPSACCGAAFLAGKNAMVDGRMSHGARSSACERDPGL
jgi:hypothetical protein